MVAVDLEKPVLVHNRAVARRRGGPLYRSLPRHKGNGFKLQVKGKQGDRQHSHNKK